MKIYLTRVNAFRPRQWAGVSRYATCMTRAIHQVAPDVEFCAAHFSLHGRLPDERAALKREFGIELVPVRWPDLSGINGYNELLDRWLVPRVIQRAGAQIAWGTNCSVPSDRRRGFRSVVTIHDLFLLQLPELAAPEFRRHTLRQARSVARDCDLILTDSEFSRRQIAEVLDVRLDRIVATYLAPAPSIVAARDEDREQVLKELGLKAPLILSVGTIEARKNYVRGLQAFARLRAKYTEEVHWLIVGGRGWQAELVYAERERLGLTDRVHVRHDISDSQLAALYRACQCLFLPSPHEGFGLPAVEAMACDLPVVAARAGALPEIVGDAAILVSADCPDEMAHGLFRVITDPALRADLVLRGRSRAGIFSWTDAASKVVEVFRKLIE